MNETSPFFISDENETPVEPDTPEYTRQIFDMPNTPSTRPKVPSKSIRKWSEYADDSAVQKSVNAVNGDLRFSLPIVKVNLAPFLKIDVDLIYTAKKDGIEFGIPLTKSFISVDYKNSVQTFYMNSMGSKLALEIVASGKFKMVDDTKGDVDVTYYQDQEYFVVESALEKLVYGNNRDTGTILYELSYKNWRETGGDPENLIKIPIAWYLAERHSKADGRSIYYHYENVEEQHKLNPKVSYTSEVMLKSIDDGNEVKVEFEYGDKESSENEELKLKNDDGNLRMGNFLMEKHFLKRIKVETESYEQDFGISYDLFNKKLRIFRGISQVMFDGKSEEVLSIKNQKILGKYLPSEIGVYHGVTTKFTYEDQVVPLPQLEKKFILKNKPIISYGTDVLSLASIIDKRIVLKIFDIKTFKLVKQFSIMEQKTIDESSVQVSFSQNFLLVTFKTDDGNHLRIYHEKDHQKWEDTSTTFNYSKDAKVHTTGRDFIVVHDGLKLFVLQKSWNENKWTENKFATEDKDMRVIVRGNTIFIREQSNLRIIFKTDDGEWRLKLLKSGLTPTASKIANLFDVTDDRRKDIQKSLEFSEIKVMNNVVIISNLHLLPNGQFRMVFNFITVSDSYEVLKEEEFFEDRENIFAVEETVDADGTNLVVKYQKSGDKYVIRIVDFSGKAEDAINKATRNKNRRKLAKEEFIKDANKNEEFLKAVKTYFLLKWEKYQPVIDNGKNDVFFSKDVKFRMTGTKWTKGSVERRREIKLGEYFKLIFDSKTPYTVELLSQKDTSFKFDIILHQPQMMVNMYPHYIAYQADNALTKLIVFDDGKSIAKHETFEKEDLMFESIPGYFMTVKKSDDLSYSEPYELTIRNMVHYLPNKPQPVVKTVEMRKNLPQSDVAFTDSDTRVTNYERKFDASKKLWTAVVKMMNGHTADENGWVEYFVSRNDEADIEQITSYYDSDKNLLKSEKKEEQKPDDKDYSDNLLHDVSGSMRISNFIPYKKSEDAFGYFGFEDYEELDGWTFMSEKVIKNGFALTGKNYLQLKKNEKMKKSFIPKNKGEIFIAAAWMRSDALKVGESTENFKALISFSADGSNYTELYGILGETKYRNGEWSNVEISIDMTSMIRRSFNNYRAEKPETPEFDAVDIKITLTATGAEDSQIDIDNIAFYPAAHRLDVSVYNENQDATAVIHNEGQITRAYFDSINYKEIGRTKKNGKLEQFLVRSEGEKDSPKVISKFSLSSGFHENFDKIMFTNRWKLSNEQNWKVLPSELMYEDKNSELKMEVRDEKMMDEKSAALRFEVSLDGQENSKFEVMFKTDSIKLQSSGRNEAELMVNGKKISVIPPHFELAIFKYLKRTVVWIDGIIKFDEILNDTWEGFSLNFLGNVSVKDIFVLNNPKVEVFYHNSFEEKQQVIKLESENSAIVTQYIYDKFGREIVKTKPTKVTKSSSESLLKFHENFIKFFDAQTGKIVGDVVTENPGDEGFPYSQTIFYKNPLDEKQKVGQPGKDYSLHSNFATSYGKNSQIPFLNAYFPDNQGYTKHVETLANGSKRILVLDMNQHKVAKYVQVPNFDNLLTTFELDSEGRILKILSPKYHEVAGTMLKTNEVYRTGEAGLSDEEKKLQDQLGIHFKYDENGNMIEKRTPDVGRQVFLYNSMNLLKFSITYNADPTDGQTIYYNYDNSGGLTETGYITRHVSVEYLQKLVESNFHTHALEFQKIQFNDAKSKTIETINHDTTVLEEIQFDENEEDKILSRKITVPAMIDSLRTTFDVQRKYIGDKVDVLTYPTTDEEQILKVKHTYNGVGQLIGIGTAEKPFCFAKFTYDANGQPTSETHELNNLNRKYGYNSPGYMNKIEDEFLTEDISYIDGGYGQLGYGDGIVMKTAYNAKWSDKFFKEHDGGKVVPVDEDYSDVVFEEDSEKNLKPDNENGGNLKPDNENDGNLKPDNENGGNLKPDNENDGNLSPEGSSEDNTQRNKILQENFPSSEAESGEDSVENRKKRQASYVDAEKLNPKDKTYRSIRHAQKEPKPLSKIESVLTNFKGFSANSDGVDPQAAKVDSKNDEMPNVLRKRNTKNLSDSKILESMQNLSQNEATDDKIKIATRDKRSANLDVPFLSDELSATKSRQSKIDEVLAHPNKDPCISALKKTNFMTGKSFRFSKLVNSNVEFKLPLKCFDSKIYDEISAKNQIPTHYGHRFTYGTHRELVKAKYFSTEEEEQTEPLQMDTFFKKVPGIAFYKSHNIFNILKDGNFIAVDQRRNDRKSSIATRGTRSLLRDDDLEKLLTDLGNGENYDFSEVFSVTKQLILHTIENKKIMKPQEFEKIFLTWKSAGSGTFKTQLEKFKKYAKKLFEGLVQQQLLPTSPDTFLTPVNKKLVNDLKKYEKSQILEIVGVVSKAFNYELLTTAFDTASYEIDANGNHKEFATGFDNVKLDYHQNTSKLKSLQIKGQKFSVDHDGYGNMTSAPHKGVKRIIYHPVSRRVMEVLLTNGGSIKFHYNAQGERILKQTFNEKYEITNEVFYVRDENGNVLMDRVMKFNHEHKTCFEIVTHYIYGPRGMIGFIRDDKFYSVFTDHSGSVRLVIRDGEVVAAYDYLPYGEMMRKIVADESADIRYLYHGKELDEETSTYNFHARFYDPTIGRFLQTDPQSQYFSPYKFSGNSPVSFIDPDGEFAFLAMLGFAYLAAAAHNKSWNPLKWDWTDPGTYLSIFIGGVTGYFLPGAFEVAFTSEVSFVLVPAFMSLTAYVSMAAANKSWNPADWKFNDPETISALFFGLAAGVSIVKFGKEFRSLFKAIPLPGKIKLLTFAGLTGGTVFYMTGVSVNQGNKKFWEWDWTSPQLVKAAMDGFYLGMSVPVNIVKFKEEILPLIGDKKSILAFFKNFTPKNIKNLKAILGNRNHPLYIFLGSLSFGYLMASAKNRDFNPINWKQDIGTYAAILSGMLTGKKISQGLASLSKEGIKAKIASEWNDVKIIKLFIGRQFVTFKLNLMWLRQQGMEAFVRVAAGMRKPSSDYTRSFVQRSIRLQRMINNERFTIGSVEVRGSQAFFDRVSNILNPCQNDDRRKRAIGGKFCLSCSINWLSMKEVFSRKDMAAVLGNAPILPLIPTTLHSKQGYVSLSGPEEDKTLVRPTDLGKLYFNDEKTPDSEPGLFMANKTYIAIDLNDREKRETHKPSVIITDQVPGTAIYIRENDGKLEIYHHYAEPESKIAITAKNGTKQEFYETNRGMKIKELSSVAVPRLFDSSSNELKMSRGAFEIPDDGVVKFIKDGEFKVLTTVNNISVQEIAKRNKEIRQRNAKTVNQKLPNFNENCDTCKAIHWEDHLPVGVIDTSYNLDIDKQLKATVVIYKDNHDNWKLSSQLIQYNKEKGGTLELADIRPKPKIFDLKLGEKKEKKKEKSHSRKPRNVEFIPESAEVPSTNFHFINNSTQNFNRSAPSVLQLGDFWLNATDFNSNLTLAYAFLKKWTNETLFSTNEGNMPKITEIEFEIFANDLLEEFAENVTKFSIKCGISKVMREILDETNLLKISKEVKRKCEKNLTEEIPKYLMMEIVEKNERKIVGKSSKKQFEKLKRMTSENLQKFADDLNERNNKLWNQN